MARRDGSGKRKVNEGIRRSARPCRYRARDL